ncbi:MAG: NAD(+) diphosphatase [Actinomycetaceae bacterium]|nr:NAD(+) diphosphatase [Actinomycetaceae bacterium]
MYKNMHCCAVVLENDDVEHLVGIAIDQPDPGHESTCMPQQDNKNSNKKNCDDKTLGDCVNNQMVSAIPSVSLSETGATAGVLSNEWSPPLWMRLRSCGATLVDWQASAVSHALALAVWHRTTRYCCVCSGLLTMTAGGWETLCRQCHRIEYPRQDPAIIVAVTDEKDRLFLAHNILWENPRSMSVIAGYVEAGESPEQAVIRESKEETNLELYDVTYVGSQAWPFPRSLMMGYRARAHSTQLQLQEDELSCGEFFTREQFIQSVRNATINPAGPATLAAVLIEDWLGQAIPYPHDLPIW